MRPFAPFVFALAAVLSLPGTGQGQLVEQPDAELAYASDNAGLPAEPAPAVPRVWYPGSYAMMNGYPPGGQYGMYGGMEMASGYYSPEFAGGYVSDASDYSAADPYYEGGGELYGEYGEVYGDEYLGGCPNCHGAGCDACGHGEDRYWLFDAIPFRGYGRFEYLYWTPRGYDVPALVTTSPQGTAQAVAGRLGQPTTNVVFGDEEISDEWRSGGRATVGIWLVPNQLVALEASYFRLENEGASFQTTSTFSGGAGADPILARPFFNVDNNMQDSVLLGFPNFVVGNQAVNLDGAVNVASRAMIESAELVRRDAIWLDVFDGQRQSFLRVYFLAGYRYFNMDEDLRIDDALVPVGGPFAPGTRIDTTDLFETDNEFHGGQIGLTAEYAQGPWAVELLAKCALGNSHEEVAVRGSTRSFDGVTATTFAGGLLAQPTNIGRESRDMFAVIPEASINLSLQVTCKVKLTAGYSFIYYSNVVRPGDQIDFGVNPTQFSGGALVGQPRPGRLFEDSEYWIHGGSAGVEVCW